MSGDSWKQSEHQVALRSAKSLETIEHLACDLSEKHSSDYVDTRINSVMETAASGVFMKCLVNKKYNKRLSPVAAGSIANVRGLKNNRSGYTYFD